jgi:hypothetical protein
MARARARDAEPGRPIDRSLRAGLVRPTMRSMDLPFNLETPLERRIAGDPAWLAGVEWGAPRRGHPEGAVKWHVAEVLANVDRLDLSPADRTRLRLAALVHDSFKRDVDRSAPRVAPNEHGFLAARWLASHVSDDRLLALVELHDEGYRAWRAHQAGRDEQALGRIAQIVGRMGDEIGLFVAFYWADNRSGDKAPDQLDWFVARLADSGVVVEVSVVG